MNRFFFICSLLLCLAGGGSVCLAADTWSYPTKKPEPPFGGGTGTQSDPYLISTAQHLANLAYMVNDGEDYKGKYFVLTNDITLNDNVINDAGTGLKNDESSYKLWTPIGEWGQIYDDDFMGIFDGKGHTIRGMVCTNHGTERRYNGLFGTTDEATIKNLNLEDCYVGSKHCPDISAENPTYGVFAGAIFGSTIINCHVSKSVVDIYFDYTIGGKDVSVGGMIGSCDYLGFGKMPLEYIISTVTTHITNCSFQGNIYVKSAGEIYGSIDIQSIIVGGLIGLQHNNENLYSYLDNCNTEGNIYFNSERYNTIVYIGGMSALLANDSRIKNCISRMNIAVDGEMNKCDISGLCNTDWYKKSYAYQCVTLGTIRIGSETKKAEITELYLCGINNHIGTLNGCAFYGNFDIHSKGESAKIALLCDKLTDAGKPSVVYSVGNIIDIDYKTTDLDQVCNNSYYYDENLDLKDTKHKSYYHFEHTPSNVTFPCKGTADASTYNKTLEEMKADGFISTLNTAAGGNVWGKLSGTNSDLDGLPMPIACGGMVTEYAGSGTAEAPWILSSEADLKALQTSVNSGQSMEGRYFKLGSDISMSGTMNSIGTSEYPFKGHLDGNGHAITGLRNSLFGYMYGTVKNLALVDCHIEGGERTGAIAKYVGDADNNAEISNCYVSGVVQAAMSGVGSAIYMGGICSELRNGSTVHDCYFKGHLIAKGFSGGSSSGGLHLVGGIVGSNTNKSDNPSVSNCYASFDFHKLDLGMDPLELTGICNNRMSNCYFVTSATNVSTGTGCTKLSSESELSASNLGSQWLQGVYRPILTSTKLYAATTPEDTPTTVYFDAIPEANPKKNYIYNVIVSGDPYAEKTVWELPNLAVYVESEQKDYITNGYLDQSSALKYKRSEGATGTLGQLHFLLTQNDKGAHFVCLPGEVLKADLPEGSDAMIVGKVTVVNDEEQVNVVHVDTIPAGVPCFIYVPVTSVKSGNNIDMLMRSGIVSEPVMDADYSSFKGTFSPQTVSEQACIDVAKETFKRAATRGEADEEAYYFIRNNEQAEVKPFSAWIESSLGNVRIVDYLLLDEYSQTNEELIENSTDDVNIKLRLTMDADKWTTICLPFDMSGEEIAEKFGQDTKLEEIEGISYDGTTLNIRLKEATDGIVTGYPYFIKPSACNSIFDLGPRILSNELSEDGYMAISPDATRELSLQMGGAYGITVLSSTKDYGAYYFNDGTLIQVSTDKPFAIGGFRCWFKASDAMASAPIDLSSVIITYSDGTTTDISVVAEDSQSTNQTVYDLRGIEMKTEKGIYIKGGKLIIKN